MSDEIWKRDVGNQLPWRDHQYIDWIAVLLERMRDIVIVARVLYGSAHETVHELGARCFVDLVFDRITVGRNHR